MRPIFNAIKPSRRHELCQLLRINPTRLITLYRQAVSPSEVAKLQAGVTYDAMIEEILDYESRSGGI